MSWKDGITSEDVGPELNNRGKRTYSEIVDSAGHRLVMWCGWTTTAYQSKPATESIQDSGGDQIDQGQTGDAQSRKTYRRRLDSTQQRQWPLTDKNGIGVCGTVHSQRLGLNQGQGGRGLSVI